MISTLSEDSRKKIKKIIKKSLELSTFYLHLNMSNNKKHNKMKTLILESKDGKVEVVYDFKLITRTVKLNSNQIDYQEFNSLEFLEWDFLRIKTKNQTK